MTLEQFIEYIEKAGNSIYMDIEDHPEIHRREYNDAIAEAFRQAKKLYEITKE